jgi:hypothetical protein
VSVIVHLCTCGHPAEWHGWVHGDARPCPTRGCACRLPEESNDVRVVYTFDLKTLARQPVVAPGELNGLGPSGWGRSRTTACDCQFCQAIYTALVAL